MERSWMQVKAGMPVECIEREFFDEAEMLETKVKGINLYEREEGYQRLIESRRELNSVVQRILQNLNEVYNQVEDYREEAQGIYRLIDINLRFYRYAEIDKKDDELPSTIANANVGDIEQLRSGIITMLNTLKNSIDKANRRFEPEPEVDDKVVYLVDLASNLEISIRFFGRHKMETEEGGSTPIDYFELLNQEKDKQQFLEDMDTEGVSDFVEESEKEMEDMFKDTGVF